MNEPKSEDNEWIVEARDKLAPYVQTNPTAAKFLELFFKFVQKETQTMILPGPQFVGMLFPWSYKPKQHWVSPICSKRIHQSKIRIAFSCLDCRGCDNSILCYECFSQSNHEGHKYLQFQTSGGCCDCGDDQAWNQKGFCPNHGKHTVQREVQHELSQLFCKEMQLAFYLYFWLSSNIEKGPFIKSVTSMYGEILLGSAADMVQVQYQLKVLLARVLFGGFGDLPKFEENNMSIIQRFFHIQSCPQLFSFNKVAIELFPVLQFRQAYIKLYLKSTYQLKIPYTHPLKELNYQYMGRAKLMSELIAAGQLKPMLIRQNLTLNSQTLNELYDKYLDDMTYVIKPQSAISYLRLHFKNINVCDMMWFRELTRYSAAQDFRKIQIDECFLKVFAEILKIIKNQTQIIQKIIRELFQYILQNKYESASLIHQRVFAMVTFVYIKSDLENLKNKQVKQQLRKILETNEANLDSNIPKLVQLFLKSRVKSQQALKDIYLKESQFRRNMNSNSPQKNTLASLDMLYVKILLLTSQVKMDYSSILERTLYSLSENKSSISFFNLTFFSVQLFTNDIDELAIANLLGQINHQYFFAFMRRISKNMKELNAKQIKTLAIMIISNPQLVDTFLGEKVKLERGKIVSNYNDPAFETLLFRKFIALSGIQLFKLQFNPFKSINRIKLFENYIIYNENSIQIMINQIQRQFNALQCQDEMIDERQPQAQEIMRQIVMIYAQTKSMKIRQIYERFSLQQKFMKSISHQLLTQAALFFNEQVETEDLNLKECESAKKRQNLMRKRKQKEELMRKKQTDMLKLYDLHDKTESQAQTCIYCKESNDKNCYLLSFCGLTNLYEQKCLKNQEIHVFFQTCGHEIHEECYLNYLSQKDQMRFCFLCKKQTNILIPSLSSLNKKEISSNIIVEFKSILFPTLLRSFQHHDKLIQPFMNGQKAENFVMIQSLVRQIVLFSLYYPKSLVKQIYNMYSPIFAIIKSEQKETIRQNLQTLKLTLANNKQNSQASKRQAIVIRLLQRRFLQKEPLTQISSPAQQVAVQQFFQKIIELYDTNIFCSGYAYDLPQSSQPIMNTIPQQVLNLLPPKPQCGLCKKLTNRLLTCLICDWVGCQADDDCMKNHTKQMHPDGTIFMFLLNGQVIYSSSFQNLVIIGSIYQDFLGECLSQEKGIFTKQKLAKYHLNTSKLEQLKRCIVHRTIHNNMK